MSLSKLLIPKGRLITVEGGELIAYLSASVSARKAMRVWFDRLAAAFPDSSAILLPLSVTDGPKGFEIHYPAESTGTIGLTEKLAEWRTDVPSAVPAILRLGRFVHETSRLLLDRKLPDALVGPGLIRCLPGTLEPWKLLPLPCGSATVGDWAKADPGTWLWLSPESLFTGLRAEPVRTLGTALHHALIGTLFPESLSKRETFQRLLRGRVGLNAKLGLATAQGLPKTFEPDALELERLILDCLQPRPIDEARVRARFDELTTRLSTDQLIRYWGFENRPDIAAKLTALERIPETVPAPRSTSAKDWGDQADDLLEQGNLGGALEAAWNALTNEGPFRARLYLGIAQRIAARAPFPVTDAVNAVSRIAREYGKQLDDADALRLLHLRLRLGGLEEAEFDPSVLNRQFESTWNEATAKLMHAWILVRRGTSYNQASKLCKAARGLYQAMPERGGEAGVYATGYLHLLDGIAHIGAVGMYGNPSFYTDAFEHLGQALALCQKVAAENEIRAGFHWLGWLAKFTRLDPNPPLSLVSSGIEAMLRSQGMSADSYKTVGIPEIPRYDENRIFPL